MIKKNRVLVGAVLLFSLATIWLLTTDNDSIWPIRNTLQYRALTWWRGSLTQPTAGETGTLHGTVRNGQGAVIGGAIVLVARRDGTTYSSRSDPQGNYSIVDLPPGTYRPVAGAPGYDKIQFGNLFRRVVIKASKDTVADVTLLLESPAEVAAGRDLSLTEGKTVTCAPPLESSAIRRQIHFTSGDQANQLSLYYTPVTATTTSRLPILLVVYPGPADSWECASSPLAAAGYAVLATGPAYSFDLESDVDELERLLAFARAGEFPGSEGRQIAIMGGSYSSLHVQLLLQRGQKVSAALLLGPPTDLFDMRRRLEEGGYVPPFGLDQALIALGLPDQASLRYWRYSTAYHVRGDFPPLAILHSRSDKVVPFQQSELLAANLEQVSAPYEIHFFDGASHYLLAEDADSDTLKIYDISLDFLARHFREF